jgi:hypothetical protein
MQLEISSALTPTLSPRSPKIGRSPHQSFVPALRDFPLLLFVLLSTINALAVEPTPEQLEFFETRVRPILTERCYKCHSAQSEKLKGGLRLDSFAGLMKGGDSGPVLTPGKPEQSKIVEAVRYQNPELQMPPKGRLPEQQIMALVEWVGMGAPWPKENATQPVSAASSFDLQMRRREHWAWQPVQPQKPPAIQNQRWPKVAPDRFILAKLEANHLAPAPEADRRTLIRRLSFDLTGLPPTPKEVDDFVRDSSVDAYENVVDRLLASPHFGERWARHWLDLVRYAETLGHEFDYPIQNAWRYRDYVIRAFNSDVAYDQFVLEHVAGDLLPNPRRNPAEQFNESVIGTGFYWLGQRDHSPVDVRQHQAELIDNQIDVLSKTFLGLTVACARCHDHKFDAISSRDFYALYGVLESSRYTQKAIDPPELLSGKMDKLRELKTRIRIATASEWSLQAGQIAKYLLAATTTNTGQTAQQLDAKLVALWSKALSEKDLSKPSHPLYAWREISSARTTEDFQRRWKALLPKARAEEEQLAPSNSEVFVEATAQGFQGWFPEGEAFTRGFGGQGDFIAGDTEHPLRILYEPEVNDAFLSRRLEGTLRSPGFEIRHRYLHVLAAGRASRIRVCVDNFTMIREPIYGGLMKRLDTDQLKWMTFDLTMWKGHRAFVELSDTSTPDPSEDSKSDGAVGYVSASRVLFSDDAAPPPPVYSPDWLTLAGYASPDSLEALASYYQLAIEQVLRKWTSNSSTLSAQGDAGSESSRTSAQLAFLDWLVQNRLLWAGGEQLASLLEEYRRIDSSVSEPVRVPAMADGDGFDEHVFIRGNHKTTGEVAPRQFLTALCQDPRARFKQGSGRLELAHAMTDPANPLLARVVVNRVWLHLFGRGIVPTPDDFGALGQPPTHPELLDWLAGWYGTEAGWSTKKLIRLLVTSSAYRMSSKPNEAEAEEKDPDNLLFHRMPVRRLEGEAIRDSMLVVSGNLDSAMFGSSVPVYLTEFMDGRGRPGSSGPMDGAGRRSIYLEVRRNFLSPLMRTFDAPVPFSTIGRRTVSNVPAQSLILLNDPFVLGQARLWAQRILSDKNDSCEQLIDRIYLMAFARLPTRNEESKAKAFLEQQGRLYGLNSSECRRNEKVWTDLCHVMFNVKEFAFIQ